MKKEEIMKLIRLQPAPHVDHITDDGHELTQLPYPFFVHEDGTIEGIYADTGSKAVIGFQSDLAVQKVNMWWGEVVKDPQLAVGKYVVTAEKNGGMAVHEIAITSVEVLGN